MEIEEALRSAFNGQVSDYKHLFSLYYPAHDSTGFTERNQTCTFVSNLLCCLGRQAKDDTLKPFVWYEAPLANKSEHIDAVVFAPAQEAVFFIEAKRFSEKKNKKGLVRDAKRLLDSKTRQYILKEYKGCTRNQYVVCLADVWLEEEWKRKVPFWWTGQPRPEGIGDIELPEEGNTFLSQVQDNGWHDNNQLIHRFYDLEGKDWGKKYCLLMGYTKLVVEQPQ